jgi:DNA polymerase
VVTPYERFRARARALLANEVPPENAVWDGSGELLPATDAASGGDRAALRVPARLVELLERAACHRDPARLPRMYRLLWRVMHGERDAIDDPVDDDVATLTRLARAVDRASHKMTAFVRFREVATDEGARFVAWFEPEHDVLARTVPFFVRRFASMRWAIATPDGGAAWDGERVAWFEVDASTPRAPPPEAVEALWLTYYRSIFNPARLNVRLMAKEMPRAYWKDLPEAQAIPALVAGAAERAGRMVGHAIDREVRAPSRVRIRPSVEASGASKPALDACRRCPLGARATQAVPGEGPDRAAVMLVGEQPGDEEDLAGRPFVGPAGKVLRRALADAGVDVARVYVTNAGKHFSYEPRGKRRIHKTPAQREIEACRHWLDGEIARVRPRILVALGATALRALTGRAVGVAAARELALVHASGARIVATYHPSAILRAPDATRAAELRAMLVADLAIAAASAGRTSERPSAEGLSQDGAP